MDNMNILKQLWHAIGRHKYTITIIGFLVIICFLDNNNLIQRLRHRRQIYSLTKEMEYYKGLRDSSVQRLKDLADDSCNLEQIAREKYGMHLPDEEIFIIQ